MGLAKDLSIQPEQIDSLVVFQEDTFFDPVTYSGEEILSPIVLRTIFWDRCQEKPEE
jgi:hypothetical protein